MNVNVAPPPAPSIGIADYLEPPVPLIQYIDMIPEQFVAPAAAPYAATASPCTATEDVASAPAVTYAAPAPDFEYVAPATPETVYNQVQQEQIIATAKPHAIVQEIPEVPVVEWVQEQIVETIEVLAQEHSAVTGLVNPDIPITADEASQVVGSCPHSEDLGAPAEVTTLDTSSTSTSNTIPVIESVTPAPVVTFNPVIEYVSEDAAHAVPTLVTGYAAPAPVGACAATSPAPAVPIHWS